MFKNPFKREKPDLDFATFAMLANAFGGGGNVGASIPEDDAIDIRNGADHIPYEVTDSRREGKRVVYNRVEKIWSMPEVP